MTDSFKWIALLACGIQLGCASKTDDLTAKLNEMEKELMQVKAENANLASQNQALDDKVLIMEKKEKSMNQDSDEKRMDVIRLSPESRLPEKSSDEISLRDHGDPPVTNNVEADGSRPVLRLTSYGDATSFSADSASAPRRSISAEPIPLTDRGDNLGVISKEGVMASAPVVSTEAGSDGMANFHMAYRAYSNKNFDVALAGFASFLKSNPEHEYADNAMYWRGECYLEQGKMLKAIGEFERLIKRYADSDQAAAALYRLGFVYDKLQDQARAKEYYFLVVERHPGTESARKASRRIATLEAQNSQAATIATSARR